MKILLTLSAVALRYTVAGVSGSLDLRDLKDDLEQVARFLYDRFTDHGERLHQALHHANDRAWRSLEIALAGESLWSWLDRKEDKAFREQVRAFLRATPLKNLPGQDPDFRRHCVCELRAARADGLLLGGNPPPDQLARHACNFARYHDPEKLIRAEWAAVAAVADLVERGGYRSLADFLRLRPGTEAPLLAIAVRYFFRRAVERDEDLARGLMVDRLETLTQGQRNGFVALQTVLDHHTDSLDRALSLLAELRGDVLDIKDEQRRLGGEVRQLHADVLHALEQYRLDRRELRPQDSLSVRGDAERQLVKQLVARYRALSPRDQAQLPALLNALAKLEVVAGDFDAAQRDFQQVARMVPENDRARAEAHFNAYRTALEQRKWDLALKALRKAASLDRGRFSPFPLDKYEPVRILGAGGFGVAFLCKHLFLGAPVVVKTLFHESLDRDVAKVFAEAQHLQQLNDPAIVRVLDCGYADLARRVRPYLVMEYFDGLTLDEHVRRHGPVPAKAFAPLACAIARGLGAAHGKGVLHRDVKPANLLVRQQANGWQVKLIDFGLALQPRAMRSTAQQQDTLSGREVAGTIDYAAPEQMGKLPGVEVGTYSDVFGFGKTCAFALFGTAQPSWHDWRKVDEPVADFLSACLAEKPADRPRDFQAVLQRLDRLRAPGAHSEVLEALPVESEVVMDVMPVEEPAPRRKPRRPPVEEVLEVEPVSPAPIPALAPTVLPARPASSWGTAQTERTHSDCTVTYQGHQIRVECSVWTNVARVHHDGVVMASGWPLIEATYPFVVLEDGQMVQYSVVIRGPGMSPLMKPYFTITRNGVVLYNDR